MNTLRDSGGRITAWDDVSSAALDPNLIKEARRREMEFVKSMKAYTRCSRGTVEKEGGKLVDVKWTDLNKGDMANPV